MHLQEANKEERKINNELRNLVGDSAHTESVVSVDDGYSVSSFEDLLN